MTSPEHSAFDNRPKLFGRRKGRPLRARKSALMQEFLPRVRIDLPPGDSMLDPIGLFARAPHKLTLEIGFGGGEHLAALAKDDPTGGLIGCEPFVNGIASMLQHIDDGRIENIRVYPGDARLLLDRLPDACLSQCFVLFPDPWPKARHAERRFIGPENLARLARTLAPGATLTTATDDAKLIVWTDEMLKNSETVVLEYRAETPPAGWIPTRYEQKGLQAGRKPVYYVCRKRM
ncbi:MAG: tRNA (guanine(46)-N(7))-methyltransferase TrmB [Bdellovibrionales bacterium]